MTLARAGFDLEIRRIASVFPHEQTIPAHVETIGREMKTEGIQKDPVLVDRDTGVVLDGMHRLAALTKMGHSNVVSCSVDYSNGSIELGRWARVYDVGGRQKAEEALAEAGFGRAVSQEEAMALLESRSAGIACMVEGKAFVRDGEPGLANAFEKVRRLDMTAELNRWPRTFVPEGELRARKLPEGAIVAVVQKVTKQDVVEAGRTGRLFPCKTSMHFLDPRPVRVNLPISELDRATTASLEERLRGFEPQLLPPGSVYEGRRYKERLLLLTPK